MCGIIGIVDSGHDRQEALMNDMLEIMSHRGPDARDTFTHGNVTLGHLRLSIIDLQGGQQPLFNDDQSLCIVFNGEIYNYKEIRARLIGNGHSFHTDSDTEVLLKGYQQYGENIVDHLNGIFSFAILHVKSGQVFLARDHFGTKPLYYYHAKDLFVFASEQKAILLHPEVPREENYAALHMQLNLRYTQGDNTLFKGIRQLPQGHCMTFDHGKIKLRKYYELIPDIHWNMTESEAIEGLHFHIEQAIKRQLVSDVPIGVYLSGGLDSSTIVQKMSALGVDEINTFTLGFNEPTDEFSDAAMIAGKFNTRHREMSLSFDPLKMYPEVLWHAEQPKINLLQGFNMSRFVKPHVKVVLGGLGGDEIFGGYDIHRIIYPFNTWHKRVPGWMKSMMKWQSDWLFKIQYKSGTLKWDEYRRGIQMLLAIGDIQKYYLILRNVWEMDSGMYDAIYTPEFSRQLKGTHTVWDEFSPYFNKAHELTALDQVLFTEMHSKMVNDYLVVDDRMSMANGVEERVPFLDVDLVNFASSIPIHLKMKGGKPKYLFRKAMQPYLPQKIVKKKKWGFTVNPYLQFKKDLKGVSEKILTREFIEQQGIFNYTYIEKILRAKPHPRMRWHYNLIWVMMGYAIWQKMYIQSDQFKTKNFELSSYY